MTINGFSVLDLMKVLLTVFPHVIDSRKCRWRS